ncbi:hypothetical protein [Bifidobacterium thermophilum]|uniref:Uncharacterized protein n=1 Tax=Bifidobacterium thermophilum TaxID=33905 RepID=A0A7X9NQT7_9BIFI|nr:hypothetical protein [Bifidobacterium thermophilum]NME61903.1 hypothetical protein [Bifidobacterium thermophilum]
MRPADAYGNGMKPLTFTTRARRTLVLGDHVREQSGTHDRRTDQDKETTCRTSKRKSKH